MRGHKLFSSHSARATRHSAQAQAVLHGHTPFCTGTRKAQTKPNERKLGAVYVLFSDVRVGSGRDWAWKYPEPDPAPGSGAEQVYSAQLGRVSDTRRPVPKPGSQVSENLEPDPEHYLSPTSGRARVELKSPGLGRAWACARARYITSSVRGGTEPGVVSPPQSMVEIGREKLEYLLQAGPQAISSAKWLVACDTSHSAMPLPPAQQSSLSVYNILRTKFMISKSFYTHAFPYLIFATTPPPA
ncbi:hypothetical protein DFH09DRAFT_1076780 [Mycena vulgaris]|nr:hypothetical protein DFH09DRAFT_1076780 [Mycena vulgaris]